MSANRKFQSVVSECEPKSLESRPAEPCAPTAVDQTLDSVRTTAKRAVDEVVFYTQNHPDRALLYAATAGYALRVLPVTRILGGVLRLAVPLVKPALLCYGLTKIVSTNRRS